MGVCNTPPTVIVIPPNEPYFFKAFAKALAIKLLLGAGAAACFCL
jgi:hypothetical protein